MSQHWQPLAPHDLLSRAAEWLVGEPGLVRVAVDGASCADPDRFAAGLAEALPALGRPAVQVRAGDFWRDASLRFEHGREDWASYLTWLDAEALRREVLDAVVQRESYLPSLRDPQTNRSTREPPRPVEPHTVVLVSGEFLLGRGLPFDRVIHFQTSAAERARHTAVGLAWALPAFERYDTCVGPTRQADVVVKGRCSPVVRGLP